MCSNLAIMVSQKRQATNICSVDLEPCLIQNFENDLKYLIACVSGQNPAQSYYFVNFE